MSKFTITTAPTTARCRDPDHGRLIIRPTVLANGSFEIKPSAERRDVIKAATTGAELRQGREAAARVREPDAQEPVAPRVAAIENVAAFIEKEIERA